MGQILAIAAGGSLGALARFWLANLVYAWLGRGFPHGTLFVNVTGSLLMGLLTELMLQRFAMTTEYRAAVLVGFLGAYTTFSTFAIETLYLFEQGEALKALLNIFLSVALCLTAVWLGLLLGRKLFVGEFLPWLGDGLPWGFLFFWIAAALGSGFAAELGMRHWQWPEQTQMLAVILVLGAVATLSTVGLALKLPQIRASLPSLFVFNALSSALMVWIGMLLGKQA
ncbi:MAG: fluoride efflux transporter CrcB [Candidatus Methylumidiphilus sp.]